MSTITAIVGTRTYAHLSAVASCAAALPGELLVGDRGIVCATAAAAARASGRRVHRLSLLDPDPKGVPRWYLRNRRLVLRAEALVAFAEKPLESTWHAMTMFSRAELPITMFGPEGTEWHPPRSAADPRPDGRPFYIKPTWPPARRTTVAGSTQPRCVQACES